MLWPFSQPKPRPFSKHGMPTSSQRRRNSSSRSEKSDSAWCPNLRTTLQLRRPLSPFPHPRAALLCRPPVPPRFPAWHLWAVVATAMPVLLHLPGLSRLETGSRLSSLHLGGCRSPLPLCLLRLPWRLSHCRWLQTLWAAVTAMARDIDLLDSKVRSLGFSCRPDEMQKLTRWPMLLMTSLSLGLCWRQWFEKSPSLLLLLLSFLLSILFLMTISLQSLQLFTPLVAGLLHSCR